jgi:hypothetical protein
LIRATEYDLPRPPPPQGLLIVISERPPHQADIDSHVAAAAVDLGDARRGWRADELRTELNNLGFLVHEGGCLRVQASQRFSTV